MSVLIKGMEMPKGSHEIIVRIQSDGRVLDQWGHRFNQEFIAVPVPPHGRLIDADAMDDILADQSEDAYNRTHAPRSWERALSAMRDYLDDAPTIIPASEEGEA